MYKLGRVKNVTREGQILLEVKYLPQTGQAVCDAQGRCLGNVSRTFGPVGGPYALVKPNKPTTNPTALLEIEVYAFESKTSEEKRKKRG
jgi:rRNA processing protein Gar1